MFASAKSIVKFVPSFCSDFDAVKFCAPAFTPSSFSLISFCHVQKGIGLVTCSFPPMRTYVRERCSLRLSQNECPIKKYFLNWNGSCLEKWSKVRSWIKRNLICSFYIFPVQQCSERRCNLDLK